MTVTSKPLSTPDASAFELVQEMLAGDPTYAINLDRIQWDSRDECYAIVEFLLCDESQAARGVTPHTSHPNRYFRKNAQKFISLWRLAQRIGAKLYLVNYAKAGSPHADQVLVRVVKEVDPHAGQPVQTEDHPLTRAEFSRWFRRLNKRGEKSP